MNLIELICKELEVEVGEIWLGNDGFEHMICKDGEIVWLKPDCGWERLKTYEDLLTGKLKPVKKPKKGDIYYVPAFYDHGNMYQKMKWFNNTSDIEYYKRGLVFKTKEDATKAANEILSTFVKNRW